LKQKDLDNLLKKIYDTFQQNDKKIIFDGIKEIYHKYLSDDRVKNYDSNKLNINLREELEKQIDHLENQLSNVSHNKNQRERTQAHDFHKKMQENSALIEEMTRIRKMNTEYID